MSTLKFLKIFVAYSTYMVQIHKHNTNNTLSKTTSDMHRTLGHAAGVVDLVYNIECVALHKLSNTLHYPYIYCQAQVKSEKPKDSG